MSPDIAASIRARLLSKAAIMAIVTTVCAVPCAEDGIRFDVESLHVSPIREEAEFGGQRAILRAYLGKARIRLQIDFGFGDAVTPAPEDSTSPTLLQGLPSSRLRTYPMVHRCALRSSPASTGSRVNMGSTSSHPTPGRKTPRAMCSVRSRVARSDRPTITSRNLRTNGIVPAD